MVLLNREEKLTWQATHCIKYGIRSTILVQQSKVMYGLCTILLKVYFRSFSFTPLPNSFFSTEKKSSHDKPLTVSRTALGQPYQCNKARQRMDFAPCFQSLFGKPFIHTIGRFCHLVATNIPTPSTAKGFTQHCSNHEAVCTLAVQAEIDHSLHLLRVWCNIGTEKLAEIVEWPRLRQVFHQI